MDRKQLKDILANFEAEKRNTEVGKAIAPQHKQDKLSKHSIRLLFHLIAFAKPLPFCSFSLLKTQDASRLVESLRTGLANPGSLAERLTRATVSLKTCPVEFVFVFSSPGCRFHLRLAC